MVAPDGESVMIAAIAALVEMRVVVCFAAFVQVYDLNSSSSCTTVKRNICEAYVGGCIAPLLSSAYRHCSGS